MMYKGSFKNNVLSMMSRLKKVKTNDKSAPFIPDDVEIYFYGGQNANKALPPPPLSKVKEEYNSCKKR